MQELQHPFLRFHECVRDGFRVRVWRGIPPLPAGLLRSGGRGRRARQGMEIAKYEYEEESPRAMMFQTMGGSPVVAP